MAGQEVSPRLLRVAVVEDDAAARKLVRRLLEKAGTAAVVAEAAGPDGIDELCAAQPDLVLLDLGLKAGVRGEDLIADILRTCPDAMIAILTGAPAEDSEAATLAAGAFVYYEKEVLGGDLPGFLLDDYELFKKALAGEDVMAPSAVSRRSPRSY